MRQTGSITMALTEHRREEILRSAALARAFDVEVREAALTDLDLRLRRLGAKRVVCFGWSTDMCVSTTIRTGANMGWEMVMVADACDCTELPDALGRGMIPATEIHRIHVATLAAEFCRLLRTADLCDG